MSEQRWPDAITAAPHCRECGVVLDDDTKKFCSIACRDNHRGGYRKKRTP